MKELLDDEEHMDAIFLLPVSSPTTTTTITSNPPSREIRAHKSVLTARAEYFKAAFRTNAVNASTSAVTGSSGSSSGTEKMNSSGKNSTSVETFKEASDCIIRVDPGFTEQQVRYALEFIYTNRIELVREISTDDLLALLQLSDLWLLRDLKRLVEHELIRSHMSVNTVARMYGATEKFSAHRLSRACIDYIMKNLRQLAGNTAFEEEMRNYPHLCMPVLKAAADLIQIVPDVANSSTNGPLHKKQRTDHHSSSAAASNSAVRPDGTPSSSAGAAVAGGGGALRSSPVPDSDT
jgi:BTB/POZ domain